MMKQDRMRMLCALVLMSVGALAEAGPLIINHNDTDIAQLTETQISRAKSVLHIAYGHTSHGSQVTDGMSGLVDFANGGGKGLSLPNDIFAWNNGGTGGALDLHDYAMGGDVGYYPDWYNNTVNYLNNPANTDVNVIVWSWCGQMDDKYAAGTLSNEYLLPMTSLETSYPDVVFVYMTGHVDIWDDANQKAACQAIRDYCIANDKVLYDFSDIECYNPDGSNFAYVSDNCDYYSGPGTGYEGNWATEWQNAHTENVDWYTCNSAHSQPLNANQKAYAAWHLWCALGADLDRDDLPDEWEERHGNAAMFDGGTNDCDRDGASDYEEYVADTCPTSNVSFLCLTALSQTNACAVSFPCSTQRVYTLEYIDDPTTPAWAPVASAEQIPGDAGGVLSLTDTNETACRMYRVSVSLTP